MLFTYRFMSERLTPLSKSSQLTAMFENCPKIDGKMWKTENNTKREIEQKSRERKKHFGNMHKISLNVANVLNISHIVAERFCSMYAMHVDLCI